MQERSAVGPQNPSRVPAGAGAGAAGWSRDAFSPA